MSHTHSLFDSYTFRLGELAEVARLAALDSAPTPAGPWLLAAVDGRAVAARSLQTGETVADPFSRTAELVPLLALRAQQIQSTARRRRDVAAGLRARLRLS